jgi:hypothetical protein
MGMGNSKVRRGVAILSLALGGFTSPLVGQGVATCYDKVMGSCNEALEASSWWEKPAVGLLCTGMLAGCGFEAI